MANCNQATPDITPEAMLDLIASSPPGPLPSGWGNWSNTIEAHRRLVDTYVDNLKPSRATYSQDRGIVIAGGGLKYFPSVWVNVNLLRHFGCALPIQLWYLGNSEMDPYMKRLLEPLGVECIDAREIEKQFPCRILCGWELKLYATLHSPFAQVLFLDADNGVVCDPTYLFDCEEYKRHGAVFWPDYACWTLLRRNGVAYCGAMKAPHRASNGLSIPSKARKRFTNVLATMNACCLSRLTA